MGCGGVDKWINWRRWGVWSRGLSWLFGGTDWLLEYKDCGGFDVDTTIDMEVEGFRNGRCWRYSRTYTMLRVRRGGGVEGLTSGGVSVSPFVTLHRYWY